MPRSQFVQHFSDLRTRRGYVEQLLRSWPTLSDWIKESREFLAWKGTLEQARRDWLAADKEGEPIPAERASMRCVREILRLKAEGLSDRAIARSTGLARSTVREYVGRSKATGL